MSNPHPRRRSGSPTAFVFALTACSAASLLSGCSEKDSDKPVKQPESQSTADTQVNPQTETQDEAAQGPQVWTYTPIAKIEDIIFTDTEVSISAFHEAIDTFVWPDGSARGMNAMVMGFRVNTDKVDADVLAALQTGDTVRLTFDAWYEPSTGYEIVAIEPLPADTQMQLRPAAPAGSPLAELIAARGQPTHTYAVAGLIKKLPSTEKPLDGFHLKHEAIPTFHNSKGEVIGMNTMTMPFPIAEGLDISKYAIDDKVLVNFAVWHEPRTRFAMFAIERLPEGYELDFRRLAP